jgi:hypothetical protein
MALEAELDRRDFRQLDVGYVADRADLVTAEASSRNRGVNCSSFSFILVTFETLGCVDVLVERNWVGLGERRRNRGDDDQSEGRQNAADLPADLPQV